LEYGSIRDELKTMGVNKPGIKEVSDAVCRIRTSKLPDPEQLGNAGSFFKNPVIEAAQYEVLKKEFPEIVSFPDADGKVKLAAGWLIEKAGWKGVRKGDASVHDRQALVIVNLGNATGSELFALAMEVKGNVKQKFGVSLEPEVNIID
jgi:UDP-N-acetylmuramate dehydrogenase